MAEILSGKTVSEALMEKLAIRIEAQSVTPKLATLRVGDNDADKAYENNASNKLRKMGLVVENLTLESGCKEQAMLDSVQWLNSRNDVHGILVFQPLPKDWDTELLRTTLNPIKDVDCSTLENLGKLIADTPRYIPGAPAGVMAVLDHYNIPLSGANVCLIGRSTVVGRPLSQLLTSRGATVTICHSRTKNLAKVAKDSEILITSAGVPNLVGKDFVHENQVVIDVSTNVVDGKLCGDINLEEVSQIVKAYTPTPGGIGAITTTILAQQVVKACETLTLKLN